MIVIKVTENIDNTINLQLLQKTVNKIKYLAIISQIRR